MVNVENINFAYQIHLLAFINEECLQSYQHRCYHVTATIPSLSLEAICVSKLKGAIRCLAVPYRSRMMPHDCSVCVITTSSDDQWTCTRNTCVTTQRSDCTVIRYTFHCYITLISWLRSLYDFLLTNVCYWKTVYHYHNEPDWCNRLYRGQKREPQDIYS